MFEDDFSTFVRRAVSIPEAKDLTRLQKMCFIAALAEEDPGLKQLNIDIISEHI